VTNDGVNQFGDYEYRNLPLSITNNGVTTNYYYDDQGNRISKVNASGLADIYIRDQNGRELAAINLNTAKVKQLNIFGIDQIGSIDVTWDGSTPTYSRQYYIKDHLGSIRLVKGSGGTILAARNFYPYGEMQQEYVNSSYNAKYKFTGKERDFETNHDYFGARYYNPELGRWYSVDPAAEKYPGWSPYNYCKNNPFNFFDPNGKEIRIAAAKGAAEYKYFQSAIKELLKTKTGVALYNKVNSDKAVFYLKLGDLPTRISGGTVRDVQGQTYPVNESLNQSGGIGTIILDKNHIELHGYSSFEILGHELTHASQAIDNPDDPNYSGDPQLPHDKRQQEQEAENNQEQIMNEYNDWFNHHFIKSFEHDWTKLYYNAIPDITSTAAVGW
jgi:RHS repeat-associated protein